MSASGSKRKHDNDGSEKRTRQVPKILMSCDACRARKVKCDLSDRSREEQMSCSHCVALEIECVFSERKKRRGPPNQYLLRLQRDAEEGRGLADAAENSTSSTPTLTPTHPLTAQMIERTFPNHFHNPGNVLDNILPRGLLLAIVDQYFANVYPLEPLVHRPSFMHSLHTSREERLGQDEWVALVLALIGTTICRMQALKPLMPRSEAQILTQKCYHLVRGYLSRDYESMSLERSIIMTFFSSFAAALGRRSVSTATRGAFIAMMIRQGLHLDSTYERMSPLEKEQRRRVFWVVYGGDVTLCTLEDIPPLLNDDDFSLVAFPVPLDDEFITKDALLPPGLDCSLLHGFIYVSQIFRLLGKILELRRRDRRTLLTGNQVDLRLLELDELAEELGRVMQGCPSELRLELPSSDSPLQDFLGDVRAIMLSNIPDQLPHDAFLVQQANIYVTQQLARFVLTSYRADLARMSDIPNIDPRSSGFAFVPHSFSQERKNKVARDLLSILKKIPTHLIAINGKPLTNKVRFVACTLLDVAPTELQDSQDQLNSGDEAQRDLLEFLKILGELEEFSRMDPVPL